MTPEGDGLSAYKVILARMTSHLVPGGRCLVEIGATQGRAVAALFEAAGLVAVTVHSDINGKPRVVTGRCAGPGTAA